MHVIKQNTYVTRDIMQNHGMTETTPTLHDVTQENAPPDQGETKMSTTQARIKPATTDEPNTRYPVNRETVTPPILRNWRDAPIHNAVLEMTADTIERVGGEEVRV